MGTHSLSPLPVTVLLDGGPDRCSDVGKRKKGVQIAKRERKQLLFAHDMTIHNKSQKTTIKYWNFIKSWF